MFHYQKSVLCVGLCGMGSVDNMRGMGQSISCFINVGIRGIKVWKVWGYVGYDA